MPRVLALLVLALASACSARTPLGDGEQPEQRSSVAITIANAEVRLDCTPRLGPTADRLFVTAQLSSEESSASAVTIVRGEILATNGTLRYSFAIDPEAWTAGATGLTREVNKTPDSLAPKGRCDLRDDERVLLRIVARRPGEAETAITSKEITRTLTE